MARNLFRSHLYRSEVRMKSWKDTSIRSKFIVGMGIVFLATFSSVLYSIYSVSALNSATERLNTASALSQNIVKVELQHMQWVNALLVYMAKNDASDFTMAKDAAVCDFGKWYYSNQRAQAERIFPEIADRLRSIEAPHKALHASAVLIEKLEKEGKNAEAARVFTQQTSPALTAVQKEFAGIMERLQKDKLAQDAVFDATAANARYVSIGLGTCAILAVVTLSCILFTGILRPLRQITDYSTACRKGECGLLAIDNQDELGILASNLSELMAHLNKQLAFSQGVLRGITVPCSVFSPQDTTVFTNQLMLNLIERDGNPEDYIGQTSGEYIWGDKNAETLSTRALKENRSLFVTREFKTRKNNSRHASISSAPIYGKEGALLGTLSVWVDMTDMVAKQLAIEENGRRISEVAASSQAVANSVSEASSDIAAQVEQSSKGALVQGEKMAETASAMTEMAATVLEVAQNAAQAADTAAQSRGQAQQGAMAVGRVLEGMATVQNQTDSVKEGVADLARQAEGIGRIISVINEIADQTNLLALNAAIEAARAGVLPWWRTKCANWRKKPWKPRAKSTKLLAAYSSAPRAAPRG